MVTLTLVCKIKSIKDILRIKKQQHQRQITRKINNTKIAYLAKVMYHVKILYLEHKTQQTFALEQKRREHTLIYKRTFCNESKIQFGWQQTLLFFPISFTNEWKVAKNCALLGLKCHSHTYIHIYRFCSYCNWLEKWPRGAARVGNTKFICVFYILLLRDDRLTDRTDYVTMPWLRHKVCLYYEKAEEKKAK